MRKNAPRSCGFCTSGYASGVLGALPAPCRRPGRAGWGSRGLGAKPHLLTINGRALDLTSNQGSQLTLMQSRWAISQHANRKIVVHSNMQIVRLLYIVTEEVVKGRSAN